MSDPQVNKDPDLQGEGNYDATRRYDKATSDFVKAGKVDEAARKAAPKDASEAADMQKAEEIGKSHAKGEDPALRQKSPPSKG